MAGVLRDRDEDGDTQREEATRQRGQGLQGSVPESGSTKGCSGCRKSEEGSSPRGSRGSAGLPTRLSYTAGLRKPERMTVCCVSPQLRTLCVSSPGRHTGSSAIEWRPDARDVDAPWAPAGLGVPLPGPLVIFRAAVQLSSLDAGTYAR